MTYQLHAVAGDDHLRLLGDYDDYPAALYARVDDVLVQLERNDGWWTRVEHVIVGPGLDGPDSRHELCTELGVDPADGRVPTSADLQDARAWLWFAHDLAAPI